VLLSGVNFATWASAQGFDEKSDLKPQEQAFQAAVGLLAKTDARVAAALRESPTKVPSAKQSEAPPNGDGGGKGINLADFSTLISTAAERVTAGGQGDAITLNLNMFAFIASSDSGVLMNQRRYEAFKDVRRWAGTISLAGTAASDSLRHRLDRPARITDDVTFQVRYRIFGSRDRRDHFDEYRRAVSSSLTAPDVKDEAFLTALSDAPDEASRFAVWLDYYNRNPAIVQRVLDAKSDATASLSAMNERVDRGLLVTLDLGGALRTEAFGPNRLLATVSAQKSYGCDLAMECTYRKDEGTSLIGGQELSLAGELGWKGNRSGLLPQGIDYGISTRVDLRDQHRESIASFTGKLRQNISDGVVMSLSVTWASRDDLVKEELVSGHVGLSYDLGAAVAAKR
jgi:hypothetical protein